MTGPDGRPAVPGGPVRRWSRLAWEISRRAAFPPPPADDGPLVTVIVATWNWSSVLTQAIHSVLRQTHRNLELLVIGDACTDDTEEVVASFDDPRVRWHNRTERAGSQTGPNNDGLDMARGEYVAYLGHDDLWLSSHLAWLLATLVREGADAGNTLTELIGPPGSNIRRLAGYGPPGVNVPPASLMHRRDAAATIRWRDWRTIELAPNDDFPLQLRDAGLRFALCPALSAFKFGAGWRPDVYRQRPAHEQAAFLRRMRFERLLVARELAAIGANRVRGRPEVHPRADDVDRSQPGWRVREARRIKGAD